HEGGIREPFIVSWPGKIKPGSKSNLISAHWDAMPTFCEIAGVKSPDDIDGISYLPTLLGDADKQEKHPYLYCEFPAYGGQQAVRLGKWKGLRMNIKKGNMKIQLFDLEKDIQELHDVSGKHPAIVKKIQQIMKKEHETPLVGRFRMEALEK